jgi:hypothetical protein
VYEDHVGPRLATILGQAKDSLNDKELRDLADRLFDSKDCRGYFTTHAESWQSPPLGGFASIPILQPLWGFPLCDLVLAFVQAHNPTCLRITSGEQTTDASGGRVTIVYSENDEGDKFVESIRQEVSIGYSCGNDIMRLTAALKESLEYAKGG